MIGLGLGSVMTSATADRILSLAVGDVWLTHADRSSVKAKLATAHLSHTELLSEEFATVNARVTAEGSPAFSLVSFRALQSAIRRRRLAVTMPSDTGTLVVFTAPHSLEVQTYHFACTCCSTHVPGAPFVCICQVVRDDHPWHSREDYTGES